MIEEKKGLEIEMFLPKFDNSGNPINPKFIDDILKEFAEKVSGGVTVYPTVYGCWFDENEGKLQCEENFVVEAILNKNDPEFQNKLNNLREISEKLREELGQAEILYTKDDDTIVEVVGEKSPTSPESIKKIRISVFPQFVK